MVNTEHKPQFLYHGSTVPGITEFKPKNDHIRDASEGPVVFATQDKAFAVLFMSPRMDDSWTKKGSFNGVYYIVISDEKRFRDQDKGGSVYVVSSEEFHQNLQIGMSTEWVSKNNIPVVGEIKYTSTFDAMRENKVRIYFVSQNEFDIFKTKTAPKEIFELLKSWKKVE